MNGPYRDGIKPLALLTPPSDPVSQSHFPACLPHCCSGNSSHGDWPRGHATAAVQLWAGANTPLPPGREPRQYSGLTALGWAVSLLSSGVLGTVPGKRAAPGFWGNGRTLKFLLGHLILWPALRAISSSCWKKHCKNRASNNNASLQFFPSLQ